jgi:mono/diheme cytochrome c family protein
MKFISAIGILLILCVLMAACQNEDQIEFDRYYAAGSLVYQNNCQNCHGKNGEGLGGLIPPLTDSNYMKSNLTGLACMVNYGLKGKITLAGKTFEGEMPPNKLSTVEIAGVLTYITNSFSNKGSTLTIEKVANDLKTCR